jgi:Arc/MetJ family transcription regulator
MNMYMEGRMSLTHIDIDDEALETAKRLGGHRTKTAAVAEALRTYNERLSRAAAYDRYFELAQDWDLEGAEAAHRADKEQPRG